MENFRVRRPTLISSAVMILLVGLGSAVLIYRTAENDSNSVLGYEIIVEQAYPIRPEDSKMYYMICSSIVERQVCLRMSSGVGLSGCGMENHLHSQ